MTLWLASVFSTTLSRCSYIPPPIDRPNSGSVALASASSRVREPASSQARATRRASLAGEARARNASRARYSSWASTQAALFQQSFEVADPGGQRHRRAGVLPAHRPGRRTLARRGPSRAGCPLRQPHGADHFPDVIAGSGRLPPRGATAGARPAQPDDCRRAPVSDHPG